MLPQQTELENQDSLAKHQQEVLKQSTEKCGQYLTALKMPKLPAAVAYDEKSDRELRERCLELALRRTNGNELELALQYYNWITETK